MHTSDYLIIFMKVLGALALLIYGMKVMSEALRRWPALNCATSWEQ